MQLFSNNFKTTLAVAVDNVATSITVASAAGLPTLSGGNTALVTLESANRLVVEIVEVTAVVSNVLTVVRGREGTAASSFDAGSFVEGRLTAGWLNDTTQELVTVDTKIDALTSSIANLATAQAAIQSSGIMTLATTPTQMAFTVTTPSTDSNVMTLNDAANTFTLLHNASFNWVSNIVLSSSTGSPRTITFRLVNTANNAILTTQSVTLEIQSGRTIMLPVNTLLTVGRNGVPVAPLTVRVEAFADATGYTIDSFSSTLASGSSYDVEVIDRLDELTDVVIALPQAGEVLRFNGSDWVNSDLNDKADVLSLATVATSGSYNDLSDKPTLGTVAAKNIPATGNASATEVVYGTDTRLSDARTPVAHSHAISDITSLQTVLNGKEPTITTLTVTKGGTGVGTLTGLVKGNGTSAMTAAVAGTDYVTPSGSITGNAATATTLQTARTINGVSFNGSANITIADSTKIPTTEKGVANGVATLDANGKVAITQIPDSVLGQLEYMGVHNLTTMPAATQKGQYWIANVAGNGYEVGDWAVYNGATFDKVDNTDAVSSVAGRTGNVVLSKADVGLSLVDNTADSSKSVASAATWTTARTITIGNAGKSVNGSTNVSWSLAEIGAQAAGNYQPLDADLTAIAGLAGTSGLLKKTAANTWTLDTSTYLTGNQNITFTGDATGSGTTSVSLTLANSGVTAGTYKSVTVDGKGRVTAGTNPTTLAGYGITDAADTSHIHSNATTLVAGFMSALDKTKLDGVEAGAQVNTVTSVAGKTGVVTLVKADVGLGNVDNTSDATKVVLSASKLITARTIAGVSFDGTANIDISYTGLTDKPKRYLNAILSDASTAITNATGYITPVELPVAGTITSIRARTATGTVTTQFKLNGVTLGTPISTTSSGVSQSVSQYGAAGSLVTIDTSSASGNGLTISVEIN